MSARNRNQTGDNGRSEASVPKARECCVPGLMESGDSDHPEREQCRAVFAENASVVAMLAEELTCPDDRAEASAGCRTRSAENRRRAGPAEAGGGRRPAREERQGDRQRANTKLRLRLRSRLSDALSGAELLPVWFVTAFGALAPSRNANDWMDAATDVLAYRLTYRITDPVVALGTPPDGHRAPRRTAWHQELTRELRRWG